MGLGGIGNLEKSGIWKSGTGENFPAWITEVAKRAFVQRVAMGSEKRMVHREEVRGQLEDRTEVKGWLLGGVVVCEPIVKKGA